MCQNLGEVQDGSELSVSQIRAIGLLGVLLLASHVLGSKDTLRTGAWNVSFVSSHPPIGLRSQ